MPDRMRPRYICQRQACPSPISYPDVEHARKTAEGLGTRLAPPLSLPSVRKRVTVPHSSAEDQVVKSVSPKMVNLGDVFPEFAAVTNEGKISFHEWLGGS